MAKYEVIDGKGIIPQGTTAIEEEAFKEMTVGEFSHFFDYLFDGKAEVRIIHNKRRQLDEVPLKGFINPDHAAELMLDSSMTVGEAVKALTDCFVDGCFVDIYPRYGNCRITKDMQLKDIKHIGGKLHDSFDSKLSIDITELELLEYTNNRKKNTSGTEKVPSPVDYYTAPLNPENITSMQDFEIRLDSLKRASGGFGGF